MDILEGNAPDEEDSDDWPDPMCINFNYWEANKENIDPNGHFCHCNSTLP